MLYHGKPSQKKEHSGLGSQDPANVMSRYMLINGLELTVMLPCLVEHLYTWVSLDLLAHFVAYSNEDKDITKISIINIIQYCTITAPTMYLIKAALKAFSLEQVPHIIVETLSRPAGAMLRRAALILSALSRGGCIARAGRLMRESKALG